MRKFLLTLSFLLLALPTNAKHLYLEKDYQAYWCNANNGVMEYKLPDYTRVDCLTNSHAIEFDFAPKVYESVGQSLYYSLMTGKRPGIVLIIENPDTECKYVNRLKMIADKYNIDYWLLYSSEYEKSLNY